MPGNQLFLERIWPESKAGFASISVSLERTPLLHVHSWACLEHINISLCVSKNNLFGERWLAKSLGGANSFLGTLGASRGLLPAVATGSHGQCPSCPSGTPLFLCMVYTCQACRNRQLHYLFLLGLGSRVLGGRKRLLYWLLLCNILFLRVWSAGVRYKIVAQLSQI